MKSLIFIILATGLTASLSAQEGSITIEQDPRIDELVKRYSKVNSKTDRKSVV